MPIIDQIRDSIHSYQKRIMQKANHAIGELRGNLVHATWCDILPNFGDLLNPLLLRHYGLTPISTAIELSELLALGSLLDNVPETYQGLIVGTGLIQDGRKNFPHANILAVRGKLTRDRIGAEQSTPLGDPGLLITVLFPKRQQKRYTLGLVPHYVDKGDARIISLQERNPNYVTMIDVQRDPKQVINEIDQCEFILSSSLHGLVTADACGIPNAWIHLSDRVIGAGFKFRDYASAFNAEIEPIFITGDENLSDLIKCTESRAKNLAELQHQLDRCFRGILTQLRQ